MSAAPEYTRQKNFLDNLPDRTDHGALNAEFDNVATSVNALRTNAAAIQRDDGALSDGIVGMEQLDDDLRERLGGDGGDGGGGENPANRYEDARGLLAERSYYDGRPKGFSFVAIDTGVVYFKLSGTIGDWSDGFPFGKGDKGDKGDGGQPGTVDYSKTVRRDVADDQTMAGALAAPTVSASQGMAAPKFTFQGAPLRWIPRNARLRLDDGTAQGALASAEVATLMTSGTDATDTGLKLANGADIGSLFDPAGSAAGKLAGVVVGEATADLTGKTSIKVTLEVVNNQLQIGVEAT
ncbi:hypothetical protein ACWKWV_09790 [Castellaniella ginsengisoli]